MTAFAKSSVTAETTHRMICRVAWRQAARAPRPAGYSLRRLAVAWLCGRGARPNLRPPCQPRCVADILGYLCLQADVVNASVARAPADGISLESAPGSWQGRYQICRASVCFRPERAEHRAPTLRLCVQGQGELAERYRRSGECRKVGAERCGGLECAGREDERQRHDHGDEEPDQAAQFRTAARTKTSPARN